MSLHDEVRAELNDLKKLRRVPRKAFTVLDDTTPKELASYRQSMKITEIADLMIDLAAIS